MSRTGNTTPASITADRKSGLLRIAWNDGHKSYYPFSLIRAACPCAGCRGGHEYMSSEPDLAVFSVKMPDSPATHIAQIEQVGSYAINIQWEDGHHYGIYNWHYLRSLCPCPVCQEERNHDG